MWMRKNGAARSVTYANASDAAIVWFTREEPTQVDATLVRQGVISQVSTPDERTIELARKVVRGASWVAVEGDARWTKYVNLDRVTGLVLEDDSPLDGSKRVHRLVLSITYLAPGNPNVPQFYVCGEIRGAKEIARVLRRLQYASDAAEVCPEEVEVEAVVAQELEVEVEASAPPPKRSKRRARNSP